jgi:hypothetical protein
MNRFFRARRTPTLRPQRDALSRALADAWLAAWVIVFILLALAMGNAIDVERAAEDAALAEQEHLVEAARAAYQQGLDDGAERELFRQQRRLAAMEAGAGDVTGDRP